MRKQLVGTALAVVLIAAACGGPGDAATTTTTSAADGEDIARGKELFESTCAACHGLDAGGIRNLGKPLANSEFVQSRMKAELVDFIAMGRLVSNKDNTTGVEMPPAAGTLPCPTRISQISSPTSRRSKTDPPTPPPNRIVGENSRHT